MPTNKQPNGTPAGHRSNRGIQIDPHTLEYAEERGANLEEINEVVSSGFPLPAKYGRNRKWEVYDFKAPRLGRYYEQKMVKVIYTV